VLYGGTASLVCPYQPAVIVRVWGANAERDANAIANAAIKLNLDFFIKKFFGNDLNIVKDIFCFFFHFKVDVPILKYACS